MEGRANTELLIAVPLASFPQEGACLMGGGLMWAGRGWVAQGPSLRAGEPHWLFHVISWWSLLGSVLALPHPLGGRDQAVLSSGAVPTELLMCHGEGWEYRYFEVYFTSPNIFLRLLGVAFSSFCQQREDTEMCPVCFLLPRPLLSWEQQPHGALVLSLVLGRALLCRDPP